MAYRLEFLKETIANQADDSESHYLLHSPEQSSELKHGETNFTFPVLIAVLPVKGKCES